MGFRMEKKNQMSREKGLIKTKRTTQLSRQEVSLPYIFTVVQLVESICLCALTQAFLFPPNNTGTSSLHCFVHSLIHNVSFVYFINQKASKQDKCSCGLEVGQEGCFCYLEPFVITSLVIASYTLLWCEDNQFNSTENYRE